MPTLPELKIVSLLVPPVKILKSLAAVSPEVIFAWVSTLLPIVNVAVPPELEINFCVTEDASTCKSAVGVAVPTATSDVTKIEPVNL